jgi:hypothetical protein
MVAAIENLAGGAVRTMTDADWTTLIGKIKRGACTPFLGAGVYWDRYSIRSAIAQKWAEEYHYPLNDSSDLASVAQFVATETDPETVQNMFIDELRLLDAPDFADKNDPYTVLASLPLPIYLTTNYDDFMTDALRKKNRNPFTEMCKWKKSLDDEKSYLLEGHNPTVPNPSVFHLHGHMRNPESLVLIEDDYFQFLINISRELVRIPHQIQKAMSRSLLLVGYRLFDWDFRVLFHLLASCITLDPRIAHVAVQISPVGDEAGQDVIERVQEYFNRYFRYRQLNVCISFLKTHEFAQQLRTKWEGRADAND